MTMQKNSYKLQLQENYITKAKYRYQYIDEFISEIWKDKYNNDVIADILKSNYELPYNGIVLSDMSIYFLNKKYYCHNIVKKILYDNAHVEKTFDGFLLLKTYSHIEDILQFLKFTDEHYEKIINSLEGYNNYVSNIIDILEGKCLYPTQKQADRLLELGFLNNSVLECCTPDNLDMKIIIAKISNKSISAKIKIKIDDKYKPLVARAICKAHFLLPKMISLTKCFGVSYDDECFMFYIGARTKYIINAQICEFFVNNGLIITQKLISNLENKPTSILNCIVESMKKKMSNNTNAGNDNSKQ